MTEINKGIDNLRSGVGKVALMTLVELSEQFERLIDSELEGIFMRVIKKSADSSIFISEEVGRAMY